MGSAITATEQELNNLTVIVDSNGFQNDGAIHQIMGHKKLEQSGEDLIGIQLLVMVIM